jgi:hypothetical protein
MARTTFAQILSRLQYALHSFITHLLHFGHFKLGRHDLLIRIKKRQSPANTIMNGTLTKRPNQILLVTYESAIDDGMLSSTHFKSSSYKMPRVRCVKNNHCTQLTTLLLVRGLGELALSL